MGHDALSMENVQYGRGIRPKIVKHWAVQVDMVDKGRMRGLYKATYEPGMINGPVWAIETLDGMRVFYPVDKVVVSYEPVFEDE